MEIILGVPCLINDEKDFDFDGDFDYMSELEKSENNILGLDGYNNQIVNRNISTSNEEFKDDIIYKDIKCNLLNLQGSEETIDSLLNIYKFNSKFIPLMFKIDPNGIDEDIQSELKEWVVTSNKISKSESLNEDEKLIYLPIRTFKVKIGKANAYFYDCKYADSFDDIIVFWLGYLEFVK